MQGLRQMRGVLSRQAIGLRIDESDFLSASIRRIEPLVTCCPK